MSKTNQNYLLSDSELASFFEHISMLLSAGIPPREGVQILMSNAHSREEKKLLGDIYESLDRGERFHEALKSSGAFPEYVNSLMTLGESSGNMDVVTSALADHYRHADEVRTDMKNAVTYPIIMVAVMIVVMVVLITQVLPVFEQVFEQLGTTMTGLSAALLSAGRALESFAVVILAVIAVLAAACLVLLRGNSRTGFVKGLSGVIPGIKKFLREESAARFASGMALALKSGMDTFTALELCEDIVEYVPIREGIVWIKERLGQGASFEDALTEAGIFDPIYNKMVGVGFTAGNMDAVMEKIADEYDRSAKRRIEYYVGVIEPTLVIILSLVVGLILLSVVLPLIGIMSGLS
ncbi:MAG: type II secretion system F family protein [Eubacterium sp.]|nr:type II secretion system F family protein [Eubacterium sp.]